SKERSRTRTVLWKWIAGPLRRGGIGTPAPSGSRCPPRSRSAPMPDAKHHVYSQPPTCKRRPLYVTPPGRGIRHAGARPLRRDPLTAQGRGARRPTPQPSAPADGLPPGTSWSRSMSDSPEVRGRDAMSANGRGAHVRLGQMLVQAGLVSAAALTAGLDRKSVV